MHPYSELIASPSLAMRAPATHRSSASPTLPTDYTIAPGVAMMPLPMMRDMINMYALLHPRLRSSTAASGRTAFSTDLSKGLPSPRVYSSPTKDFDVLL